MALKQRVHTPSQLKDSGGNTVDFHISDGEDGVVDISAGYSAPQDKQPKGFFICPLEAGTIVVQLVGQTGEEQFTIPTARVEANAGFWMEEKCIKIISTGTTVTQALIGWAY